MFSLSDISSRSYLVVKNLPAMWGELGSIPGLGRFPGKGNGYLFQYSGLENSMDSIVHGVTKSWTRLSDFHFHFHHYPLRSLLQRHLFCFFSLILCPNQNRVFSSTSVKIYKGSMVMCLSWMLGLE